MLFHVSEEAGFRIPGTPYRTRGFRGQCDKPGIGLLYNNIVMWGGRPASPAPLAVVALVAANQTALILTIWKAFLLAPIKSFPRLLRNSGKKSAANQTGVLRVSLLFGKDLPQVTIELYARSVAILRD
jgi:hypothetical protein